MRHAVPWLSIHVVRELRSIWVAFSAPTAPRTSLSQAGQDGLAAAGQTLADVLGGTAAPMA